MDFVIVVFSNLRVTNLPKIGHLVIRKPNPQIQIIFKNDPRDIVRKTTSRWKKTDVEFKETVAFPLQSTDITPRFFFEVWHKTKNLIGKDEKIGKCQKIEIDLSEKDITNNKKKNYRFELGNGGTLGFSTVLKFLEAPKKKKKIGDKSEFPVEKEKQKCWKIEEEEEVVTEKKNEGIASNKEIEDLKRKLENIKDERLCVVCLENPKCYIFLPCGHVCCCRKCSEKIESDTKVCPLCRVRINSSLMVYM